jgi:hypothetical protein
MHNIDRLTLGLAVKAALAAIAAGDPEPQLRFASASSKTRTTAPSIADPEEVDCATITTKSFTGTRLPLVTVFAGYTPGTEVDGAEGNV